MPELHYRGCCQHHDINTMMIKIIIIIIIKDMQEYTKITEKKTLICSTTNVKEQRTYFFLFFQDFQDRFLFLIVIITLIQIFFPLKLPYRSTTLTVCMLYSQNLAKKYKIYVRIHSNIHTGIINMHSINGKKYFSFENICQFIIIR